MQQDIINGCLYRWVLPSTSEQQLYELSSRYNLSLPLMQVLIKRGLSSVQQLDEFLFATGAISSGRLLKDAEKAARRIIAAIEKKEKILVVGDYDVDGITATSLMMLCLSPLGAQINYFLPNRTRDGYGLSEKVIKRAIDNHYSLIITVDNGITACGPAQLAYDHHIDLIITDHHLPHENLPLAYAIVDPSQLDCPYPFKSLAGVGVAFKVISLLYELLDKRLPDKVYELLLLGTIADVVPLLGENRYWVRYGLQKVQEQCSYSLQALKKNAKFAEKSLSSLDIAFSITPQLNALGRLEDPRNAVRFLIGARCVEVDQVASILYELNEARKTIERSILNEIEWAITQKKIDLDKENIIIAASDKWPAGVIGLVASRLTNQYNKPALLFHITKDGLAKGSARSISAFNIFEALQENAFLLERFGGHAGAAGLSLKKSKLPELKELLEQKIARDLSPEDLIPRMVLEAQVQLGDLTAKFMDDMRFLEPFGHMNDAPLFFIDDVTLVDEPTLLKDQHVKCKVFSNGVIKPVIFFGQPQLFSILSSMGDRSFALAATVMENHWQGTRSIELKGLDIGMKVKE